MMMKVFCSMVCTSLLLMSGCQHRQDTKAVAGKTDSLVGDSVRTELTLPDSISGGESLNDIRFSRFEEKDWLDNEYIHTLSKRIDSYRKGKVDVSAFSDYKKEVEGQCVIYNVEPFMMGGLFIQFVFIDVPDKLFSAWVYSDVDTKTRRMSNYEVRNITVEEMENPLPKEEILQIVKEHPELMMK